MMTTFIYSFLLLIAIFIPLYFYPKLIAKNEGQEVRMKKFSLNMLISSGGIILILLNFRYFDKKKSQPETLKIETIYKGDSLDIVFGEVFGRVSKEFIIVERGDTTSLTLAKKMGNYPHVIYNISSFKSPERENIFHKYEKELRNKLASDSIIKMSLIDTCFTKKCNDLYFRDYEMVSISKIQYNFRGRVYFFDYHGITYVLNCFIYINAEQKDIEESMTFTKQLFSCDSIPTMVIN